MTKDSYKEDFWKEKRDSLSSMLFIPKIEWLIDFIYTRGGMLRSKDQSKWILKTYNPKNKKILEIGFGYGGGIIYWNKKGYNIEGIEPDSRSVNRINKIIGKKLTSCKKIEDISRNKKFDLIIMSHVLEHIDDLENFFNIAKKMQPVNGAIFIEVPNCFNKEVLGESRSNDYHMHHFTTQNLIKLFERNGYSVKRKETLISKIDQITKKIYWYKRILRLINVMVAKDKSIALDEKKADIIRILAFRKDL